MQAIEIIEATEPNYPILKKSESSGRIVLFVKPNCGTVVFEVHDS